MKNVLIGAGLALLLSAAPGSADPLEYIGNPVRGIPVSSAVKVGKSVFVSGMPAFDSSGKLAVGDFSAQTTQVMGEPDSYSEGIRRRLEARCENECLSHTSKRFR